MENFGQRPKQHPRQRENLAPRRVYASMLALSATAVGAAPSSAQSVAPRYLDVVADELAGLHLEANCETIDALNARCSWLVLNEDRTRELIINLVVDDARRTVYLFANIGRTEPNRSERTNTILRRVGELNWASLSTKLEWNPTSGDLRVSALQHTDSNFDRRAFRILARMIGREGLRLALLFDIP